MRPAWRRLSAPRRLLEGGVRRRMQVAIELARLAEREAAQHLARMIPERRADLGHHRVALLQPPRCRKLARHARSGALIDVVPM